MGEDSEATAHGHSWPVDADTSGRQQGALPGESGWVTTDVAARAVRVSPRTIRRYIERGELVAKTEGEGVERRWLVSVDSLHALRMTRTESTSGPGEVREEVDADSIADVLRDMSARIEERTAEAVEMRTRLELSEKAQSTTAFGQSWRPSALRGFGVGSLGSSRRGGLDRGCRQG